MSIAISQVGASGGVVGCIVGRERRVGRRTGRQLSAAGRVDLGRVDLGMRSHRREPLSVACFDSRLGCKVMAGVLESALRAAMCVGGVGRRRHGGGRDQTLFNDTVDRHESPFGHIRAQILAR